MGIDPPEDVTPRNGLVEGEAKRGYGAWKSDPYGVGEDLSAKRIVRGWKADVIPSGVDERVNGLLHWRGGKTGEETFAGDLPWTSENLGSDAR